MDDEPVKLYTMIRRNTKTLKDVVVYGHATANVMDRYWQAYVDDAHIVIIQEWQGNDGP